jgi:hypothetical protein
VSSFSGFTEETRDVERNTATAEKLDGEWRKKIKA